MSWKIFGKSVALAGSFIMILVTTVAFKINDARLKEMQSVEVIQKMIVPSRTAELTLIWKDKAGYVGDMMVTPASYATLEIGDHIRVLRPKTEVPANHDWIDTLLYVVMIASFLSMVLSLLWLIEFE